MGRSALRGLAACALLAFSLSCCLLDERSDDDACAAQDACAKMCDPPWQAHFAGSLFYSDNLCNT